MATTVTQTQGAGGAPTVSMKELLEAGVHFGHQTKRWNPKMKPFIYDKRNAIYIIDLGQTVRQLQHAADYLAGISARNGKVLFVGCKKSTLPFRAEIPAR